MTHNELSADVRAGRFQANFNFEGFTADNEFGEWS